MPDDADSPSGARTLPTIIGRGAPGTLPGGTGTPDQDTIMPTDRAPEGGGDIRVELPPMGYELGELIGKGGMGEVVAAHDLRIGRDVAIKRMRSPHPNAGQVARFLREARIQARLDHPAIVPVYELGTDDDGKPFFTMKRLAGTTLAERLAARAPLPLLLRAFVDVCLAVELAHSRGVVHRDLKPANIMLGDYGEVYVLDWGVARVLADASAPAQTDIETLDGGTASGMLLGTPGYMAPEQIQGLEVVPATDVYALGSILFEILTMQPLHPRGEGALGSTLTAPQQSPAKRIAGLVPPELDAACHDAVAESPAERPTARALADRVQRYLDGDRDLERRRALAAEQLVAARAAFDSRDAKARETAVRHASRALALDPDSEEAAGVVSALVFEPPAEMPPALQAALDEDERAFQRVRLKRVMFAYAALLATWIVIPFFEVIDWSFVFIFSGLVAVAAANTYRTLRTGRHDVLTSFAINMLMIVAFSRVGSPFILTPTLIASGVLTFSSVRQISDRPWLLVSWVTLTVMAPIVLEWLHVIPASWTIHGGRIEIVSQVFALRGTPEVIGLTLVNLVFQLVVCWSALGNSRARWDSARSQLILAWHLKQMLPEGPRPWPAPKRRA